MSDPTVDLAIKTTQMPHQAEIYLPHRDDLGFAVFDEMGLGKGKLMIDVMSHLFLKKRVDGVIILAPNAVYSNWTVEELPKHCAVPYVKILFNSGSRGDKAKMRRALFLDPDNWEGKLRVLCMSYDGLKTDHGFKLAHDFSILYRVMIIADESTAMKNAKTETAKRAKQIRANCQVAWIASGTPIADKPFDIHSQIEFLFPEFWRRHGMKSYAAFKNQFGVYELRRAGMRVWSECVGYQNVDRLQSMIKSISCRRLKDDSNVKLPPKMYKTVSFTMARAQRKLYEQLREEFAADLGDDTFVEATLAIVRLTRLQQIACGFVTADEIEPQITLSENGLTTVQSSSDSDTLSRDEKLRQLAIFTSDDIASSEDVIVDEEFVQREAEELYTTYNADSDIPWAGGDVQPRVTRKKVVDIVPREDNPRLKVLVALVEECSHKMIVWCRFKRDIENICETLGEQCVRFDGSVGREDRETALRRFKDPGDSAKVFVANIHTISQGVTLTIAKTMVYYSNSFSPEKRLQSEDRAHRIGQDQSVLIIDLVARGTVDVKLIDGLRKKYELSARVMGDRYRDWIQPIDSDEEEE